MMRFTVKKQSEKPRLDTFLTAKMGTLARSFIAKLNDQGKVLVNGQKVKAGHKLSEGDKVEVDFDPKHLQPAKIDLPVLYEDDDCVVVNKPVGVLTHSKGAFNPEGTVASFIQPKLKGLDGDRGGVVHRLDRATSGVLIAAKTPEALGWLQKQFSQRKVKKTYYAVIEGEPELKKAIIEVPIERNPKDPKTFRPGNAGKPAVTEYEVVKSGNGYSLLKLQPTTGRTHQLRVHLKYLGHPIVGDPIYEGKNHQRLLLHAEKLELTLPNHQRKVFEAKLPAEFRAILKA